MLSLVKLIIVIDTDILTVNAFIFYDDLKLQRALFTWINSREG